MFSQYIETNSGTDPKGVEIYNNSGVNIDFSITPLEVFKGTNGAACSNDVTVSSGILLAGEVWVIGTVNLVTYAQNNGANLSGTTIEGFTFNGDDALELYLGGTLYDVIGTCGSDPGGSWSGSGVSTANQNITILNGICSGTTTYWTDPSLRFSAVSTDPINDLTGFGDAPTCSSNTISTDAVSALLFNVDCATTDNGTVDFSSVGSFNAGNTFTAQLSDVAGSFSSPLSIGSLALDGTDPSGSISITIPAGTISGTGYRIRVISDDPVAIGSENSLDIEIDNAPCSISISSISSLLYNVDCSTGDTGSLNFTSIGTYAVGNTFSAELSDGSGSFASPTSIGTLSISGTDPSGTISFTIPAGSASGTGYRIRVVSDDPIITGSDNGSDIEIVFTPCPTPLPASGGLLINEFSNGSSGNQEFYEFIVAGQCGETVDVRGYIIDDNNGTFTDYTQPGTPGGSGIADGHLRLTNDAQWSNIPVGSVIVVYNAADPNSSLPGDDVNDSNNDSLYVIPHNNTTLFEIETQIPNATDPDSTYSPSTYAGTGWSALSIANDGDAVQVRQPDGTYFHGVSYGGVEITGGPDGTKITTGGLGGMNGIFSSNDFTDPANWSTGSAPSDETPGTFNNALNEQWLRLMRDPNTASCPVAPLPVTLVLFEGHYSGELVALNWQSSTEQNNDYFIISHSTDGYNFRKIGTENGSGSVSHSVSYQMDHRGFNSGINYYKLQSVDFDGTIHEKGIIAILVDLDQVYYDDISSQILFPNNDEYYIFDTSGKLLSQNHGRSSVLFNQQGVFLVINKKTGSSTKLIIQ